MYNCTITLILLRFETFEKLTPIYVIHWDSNKFHTIGRFYTLHNLVQSATAFHQKSVFWLSIVTVSISIAWKYSKQITSVYISFSFISIFLSLHFRFQNSSLNFSFIIISCLLQISSNRDKSCVANMSTIYSEDNELGRRWKKKNITN